MQKNEQEGLAPWALPSASQQHIVLCLLVLGFFFPLGFIQPHPHCLSVQILTCAILQTLSGHTVGADAGCNRAYDLTVWMTMHQYPSSGPSLFFSAFGAEALVPVQATQTLHAAWQITLNRMTLISLVCIYVVLCRQVPLPLCITAC